jgi:hypothetical protein
MIKKPRERERNRVRSTVDELPDDGRKLLDELLADVRYTYDEIAARMAEKGWPISRSSIGRYALRQNAVARRIKEAREQTMALIGVMRDNRDIETSELASSVFLDALTRRIATADEEFEKLPLDKAGRLLVQLQRTAVYKERMRSTRARACKDVEQTILRRMREQIQGDPDLLARITTIVQAATEEEAKRDDEK